MSRKAKNTKRTIAPDHKYGSVVVAKVINHLMVSGNKSLATKIVYSSLGSLDRIAKEKKVSVLDLFLQALQGIKPRTKMKSRRVGGATYQVPRQLNENESEMIAIKWLISAARSVSGKSMAQSLANVLIETIEGRGSAIKKKEEMHRVAEANKAFAHFA